MGGRTKRKINSRKGKKNKEEKRRIKKERKPAVTNLSTTHSVDLGLPIIRLFLNPKTTGNTQKEKRLFRTNETTDLKTTGSASNNLCAVLLYKYKKYRQHIVQKQLRTKNCVTTSCVCFKNSTSKNRKKDKAQQQKRNRPKK